MKFCISFFKNWDPKNTTRMRGTKNQSIVKSWQLIVNDYLKPNTIAPDVYFEDTIQEMELIFWNNL